MAMGSSISMQICPMSYENGGMGHEDFVGGVQQRPYTGVFYTTEYRPRCNNMLATCLSNITRQVGLLGNNAGSCKTRLDRPVHKVPGRMSGRSNGRPCSNKPTGAVWRRPTQCRTSTHSVHSMTNLPKTVEVLRGNTYYM